MRTALFIAALAIASPAAAGEFVAPPFQVSGKSEGVVTGAFVYKKYLAHHSECTAEATGLPRAADEPIERYRRAQNQQYLWCMRLVFANNGIFIEEVAP